MVWVNPPNRVAV